MTNNYDEILKTFTGRQDATIAFDELWSEETSTWILAFDGFSGLGKSTLLRWLELYRCKANKIPYCLTDFESHIAYDDLLASIFRSIRNYLPKEYYDSFLRKSSSIREIRDKALIQISQNQTNGESNEQIIEIPNDLSQTLEHERRQTAERARRNLSQAWLECLENFTGDRLVLLWDTFERFTLLPYESDWLWNTFEEAHKIIPGLRVVVASREQVKPPYSIISKPLRAFNRAESDSLLASLGVEDEVFYETVYERLAHGHPGVTRFASTAWLNAKSTGKPLSEKDAPSLNELKDAVLWIHGKIIDRLKEPFKSTVVWMPLLRSFNLDVLNAVLPSEIPRLTLGDLDQLTRYALIEYDGKTFRCHDLLRQFQIGYLRTAVPIEFSAFQKRARQYYKIQNDFYSKTYHRFFYDPEGALARWKSRLSQHIKDHLSIETLFEIADSVMPFLRDVYQGVLWTQKGHYLREQGQIAASRQSYERALIYLETESPPKERLKTLLGLAVLEGSKGNISRARMLFEKAMLIDPNYVFLLQAQALIEKKHKNIPRARELFQKAADIGSGHAPVFQAWALMEKEQRDIPRARELFQKAANIDPTHTYTWQAWAVMEKEEGDIPRARELFQKATSVGSHHTPAWQAWALMEKEQRDIPRARELFQKAADIDPNHVPVWHAWALMEKEQRDIPRARELFQKAADIDPSDVSIWQAWALMEKEQEDIPRARELFQKAAFIAPKSAYVLSAWALMEREQGDILRARELFQEIISSRPNNTRILKTWARMEREEGDISRARDLMQRVTDIDPSDSSVWRVWALMERGIGDISRARTLIQKAVDIDPGDLSISQAQAKIEREYGNSPRVREKNTFYVPNQVYILQTQAMEEKRQGNILEARKLFEEAASIAPNNSFVLHAWSKLEYENREYEKALALALKAIDTDSKDPYNYHIKGLILKALNQGTAAKESFQESLRCIETTTVSRKKERLEHLRASILKELDQM